MTDRQIGYPATWSPCKSYRYTLWRRWNNWGERYVQFIGLNPSTATELIDDPTVLRCINYAKAWGYDAMCMTNLFAYRATNPKVMKAAADPIGWMNDHWLMEIGQRADARLACWGAHGKHIGRAEGVLREFAERNLPLHCLSVTKSGEPGHPLYLRGDLRPVPYE